MKLGTEVVVGLGAGAFVAATVEEAAGATVELRAGAVELAALLEVLGSTSPEIAMSTLPTVPSAVPQVSLETGLGQFQVKAGPVKERAGD
jgi:hypothetical protein